MKPSKNPWVLEKTKSSFDRECALSQIPYIIRPDGSKGCIWCGEDLKTKHPLQRYCKDKACPKSAYMWGYPQRPESLFYLLLQQDLKCKLCLYDYKPYFPENSFDEFSFNRIKSSLPPLFKPEVDHIKPIIQGGQSLGLDNHQAICYTCHKAKTKQDVRGPKRIKSPEEIQKARDKRTMAKIYDKMGPFLDQYYTNDYKKNWLAYREIFLLKVLTLEELECIIRERSKYPDRPTNGFEELSWAKEALALRTKPSD